VNPRRNNSEYGNLIPLMVELEPVTEQITPLVVLEAVWGCLSLNRKDGLSWGMFDTDN
jgi:hypothetical protein